MNEQLLAVAAKDGNGGKIKKAEFIEQKFRIDKWTTFRDLQLAACNFWALELNEFRLYDDKNHEIMLLNGHQFHPAHRVEKYFRFLMVKNTPTLLL